MLIEFASALVLLMLPEGAQSPEEALARYRSGETQAARREALEALGALAGPPGGPAAGEVARALVTALGDEAFAVRARAVELLVDTGARAVAAPALLDATRALRREEAELIKIMKDTPPLRDFPLHSKTERERKQNLEEFQRFAEELRAYQERLEAYGDLHLVRDALIAAWESLGGEEAVSGFGLLIENERYSARSDRLVDGLLSLGTGPAIRHLVGVLQRYEGDRRAREKRERELAREKPRKKPSEFYADEVWERLELERIHKARQRHAESGAEEQRWIDDFTARIRFFASEAGLEAPPRQSFPAQPWRLWEARVRAKLPASVE